MQQLTAEERQKLIEDLNMLKDIKIKQQLESIEQDDLCYDLKLEFRLHLDKDLRRD